MTERSRGANPDDEATDEFGPYLVHELLGQGGMAMVHRAEKRGVGIRRQVALKRLLPHVADDPELVQLFVDEARLASHLHHANVAQTYDLGKVDDTFFIAMEYAPGPTLSQIVRQCQRAGCEIPIAVTVDILGQIADALDYAHNLCDETGQPLRIIHRDVSPGNIVVTNTGVVKLIDFGIAKATISSVKTQAGFIKGKFGYIAPEYIFGGIDSRVDLFAFGVVAHEMLAGRRLFEGKDDFETLDNIRSLVIQPPSKWTPAIPKELDEVVMTALARDPDHRWQTAGAMRIALTALARSFGTVVGPAQVVEWVEWAFSQLPREPEPARESMMVDVGPPSSDTEQLPHVTGAPRRESSVLIQFSEVGGPPLRDLLSRAPSESNENVRLDKLLVSFTETPPPELIGRPRAGTEAAIATQSPAPAPAPADEAVGAPLTARLPTIVPLDGDWHDEPVAAGSPRPIPVVPSIAALAAARPGVDSEWGEEPITGRRAAPPPLNERVAPRPPSQQFAQVAAPRAQAIPEEVLSHNDSESFTTIAPPPELPAQAPSSISGARPLPLQAPRERSEPYVSPPLATPPRARPQPFTPSPPLGGPPRERPQPFTPSPPPLGVHPTTLSGLQPFPASVRDRSQPFPPSSGRDGSQPFVPSALPLPGSPARDGSQPFGSIDPPPGSPLSSPHGSQPFTQVTPRPVRDSSQPFAPVSPLPGAPPTAPRPAHDSSQPLGQGAPAGPPRPISQPYTATGPGRDGSQPFRSVSPLPGPLPGAPHEGSQPFLPVAALPPGAPAFIQTPPYPAGSPAAPAQPAIKAKLPPAPAGPIHKRRTLLWLILLMVALGVAAMAIAYYWPSSSL